MAWYDGSVTDAITASKNQAKLFVVYLHGNDEASGETNQLWEDGELVQACKERCICIKLAANSDSFNLFSKIYPVVVLPVVFLIGRDGIPLEIIADCTSSEQLLGKISVACKKYQEQVSSSSTPLKPTVSSPTDQTAGTSGSTENHSTDVKATGEQASAALTTPSEDKAAAAALLQEKINQKRIARQKEAEEKERNDEIERRNLGRSVQHMREKQQEIKTKNELAERKLDKQKEKEALERVRQQIARDREERQRKFQKEKEERAAKTKQMEREREEIALKKSEERSQEKEKVARIQFRLPDGSTVMRQYSRETTLAEVIEDLRAQPVRLPVSFRLAMGLPRRVFQAEDESSTVADLGLTPSASVAVQPCSTQVQKHDAGFVQSILQFLFLILSLPVKFIMYVWNALAGSRQGHSSHSTPTPSSDRTSSSGEYSAARSSRLSGARHRNVETPRTEGRTYRLGDLNRDDDDAATWNGNSTQQM